MTLKATIECTEELQKTIKKLRKKDAHKHRILKKKMNQIVASPEQYKPLKGRMHGLRRVHINTHFVLLYEYKKSANTILFLSFDHHDDAYE